MLEGFADVSVERLKGLSPAKGIPVWKHNAERIGEEKERRMKDGLTLYKTTTYLHDDLQDANIEISPLAIMYELPKGGVVVRSCGRYLHGDRLILKMYWESKHE